MSKQYNYKYFNEDIEPKLDNCIFGSKLFIFFLSGDILFNLILLCIPFSAKCNLLIRSTKIGVDCLAFALSVNLLFIIHFGSIDYGCGDKLTTLVIKSIQNNVTYQSIINTMLLVMSIMNVGVDVLEYFINKNDMNEKKEKNEVKLELYS